MHALVLHNMGDPARWREAIADLELALPQYARGVRCLVHDTAIRVPDYVQEFPFDLIVLNSSFLGAVTHPDSLAFVRERYGFLTRSTAYKVALPQDDYYCSEELDALLTEWGMDAVHTVCPDHWDVLYPKYLAAGGDLRLGYTGYVTPRMRRLAEVTKPRAQRRFDVVYRATGRPGFPNGMAVVKARLGDHFIARFGNERWATDITTDDRRVITGSAWWRFLADSRATLGSNSGSSVLIRNLTVAQTIRAYQDAHPEAPYDEVAAACIPPTDRELEFTAISPRLLEAALVETTQLLVPGPYSGMVDAGEHYWPLAPDCSNEDEIRRLLGDHALQSKIAGACKRRVLEAPALQVESFLDGIIESASAKARGVAGAGARAFEALRIRYAAHVGMKTKVYYLRQRLMA